MNKILCSTFLFVGLINAAGSASDYRSFGQIARAAQRWMRNPASNPNPAELLVRTQELIDDVAPVKVSHLALFARVTREEQDLAAINELIVGYALDTQAEHLVNVFEAVLAGAGDEPRDSDSSASEDSFDSDSGNAGSDSDSDAKRIRED